MVASTNIWHGYNATITDFPHSAFIFGLSNNKYVSICGASILTNLIVLTAAHCVESFKDIEVFAGHAELDKITVKRKSAKEIMHKDYSRSENKNNIGLILLQSPLPLGPTMQRVLITPKYPFAKLVTVASWGKNSHDRDEANILQYTVQKVVKNKAPHIGNKELICTKNIKPDKSKRGYSDSGSALIVGKRQQIGIVNNLYDNINTDRIITYTNVTYHYDWLKEQISNLCNN